MTPREVLIAHQRHSAGCCTCGWGRAPGELGKSHADHVISELEKAGYVIMAEGDIQDLKDAVGEARMGADW